MIRLLIYILLSGLFVRAAGAVESERYAGQSVLSSGKWVKMRITDTGVYKLTYDELRSLGFSDPSAVSVFGYGGASLPEDFRADYIDELLFGEHIQKVVPRLALIVGAYERGKIEPRLSDAPSAALHFALTAALRSEPRYQLRRELCIHFARGGVPAVCKWGGPRLCPITAGKILNALAVGIAAYVGRREGVAYSLSRGTCIVYNVVGIGIYRSERAIPLLRHAV